VAERLEQQLVQRLNLTAAQQDRLPEVLAELDLPLEHVDPRKASKDSASYIEPGPKPFTCDNCEHYDNGECEIVDGGIDPKGSCKWWHHPKEEEAGATEEVAVYNKVGD
jgi:hypothetical protein